MLKTFHTCLSKGGGISRSLFCFGVFCLVACEKKAADQVTESDEPVAGVVSGQTLSKQGGVNSGMIQQKEPLQGSVGAEFEILDLNKSSSLTTGEAINKLSLRLLGRPASMTLKKYPRIYMSATSEALSAAFDELTSPQGEYRAAFADWIVNVLRDQWKLQVIRNDGAGEKNTWLMPPTPQVMEFNRKYLTLRPDRIYLDLENPAIYGGDGFDLPPSDFDNPGDAGYALYELEPLLYGAFLIMQNRPFGAVVAGSETVRSSALHEFSESFTAETPKFLPTGLLLDHWSGVWEHGERKEPSGTPWGGGVLSTIGFLRTYVRERTWAARGIYGAMLCREISESSPPPEVLHLEKVGDPSPIKSGGSCAGCHYMLDSLANLRMDFGRHSVSNRGVSSVAVYPAHFSRLFDVSGENFLAQFNSEHQSSVTQWPMVHYLLKADGTYVPVKDFGQLGTALAALPEFHQCQVKAFVDALVLTESPEAKTLLYQTAFDAYFANNQSIKAALKAVVLSEAFNARPR